MKRGSKTPDVAAVTTEITDSMANVREALGPVDETVLGYKLQLERDGWSTPAAEQMAVALHQMLIARIFTGG